MEWIKERISHPNDDPRCEVFIDGKWFTRTRVIMENHLRRALSSDEVVHHINGDTMDDRIENLQVMSNSEHATYHNIRDKKYRHLPPQDRENNPRWTGEIASEKTKSMRLWRKQKAATHTKIACWVDKELYEKLNRVVDIALTEDKTVTKASTIRAILEIVLDSILEASSDEGIKRKIRFVGILRSVAE